MSFTSPDDLLRLAPDARALEAGRRLFYSRRWRLVGGDGQWLWGEFAYGNDGKAIEAAVHLVAGRFYCSCRSRQRPCVHGLALVIMLKNDQERITVGQPPSWVRSVQHQADRQPVPAESATGESAPSARRMALMDSGVAALEVRLLDIARRGIADTRAQGPELLRAAAARLTDANLPGPAAQLRRLAAQDAAADETAFCRTLGDLYLFVRAWKNREGLSSEQWAGVLQFAGVRTRKAEVLAGKSITDHWLVVGQVEGQEDNLRFRRVWLRGEQSRRFVLLLEYAFGNAAFERAWPLAAAFAGAVFFYPGSYLQRVVFPQPTPSGRPYDGLNGYADFAAMRKNYQKAIGANPWLFAYPVLLNEVWLQARGEAWEVRDRAGEVLDIATDGPAIYPLLALSGGESVKLFGEFDGYTLRPLSVMCEAELISV